MADETTQVRIVPAQPADAASLVSFLQQANQESDAVLITNLAHLTAASETDQLKAIAKSDHCEVIVARLGQQVIGTATIMIQPDQDNTGELGVVVAKEYWHQGIGTALLETILDWYQHGSELQQLVLDVFADNHRAIDLYHRFGFVESELHDYHGQLQLIRMVYMEKG